MISLRFLKLTTNNIFEICKYLILKLKPYNVLWFVIWNKCITTVAGLADDLDIKRICKAFKKNFSCNGAIQKDEETDGEVIQLSGDQRTNVMDFLTDQEICLKDEIVLHGF